MKLLVIGGFLGSGKTTLIGSLLNQMEKAGQKAAIIENEYGEIAIDDLILAPSKTKITTIAGGCVCCQITGSLIGALSDIEEDVNPHWCILELSGMAITADAVAGIRKFYRKDLDILTVAVADARRWEKMIKLKIPAMMNQLRGADLIFLSKTDLMDALPQIKADGYLAPMVTSKDQLWDLLCREDTDLPPWAADRNSSPTVQPIEGEVQTTHYQYEGSFSIEDIKMQLKQLIDVEAEKVQMEGIIPGHIKGLVQFEGGALIASMTEKGKLTFYDDEKYQGADMKTRFSYYRVTIHVLTVKNNVLE